MDQVHVRAAEGIMHLKESVPDAALRDALMCAARRVPGTVDVTAQSDFDDP
ncbi:MULTISPECIES: hypothetical protein [unclassified Streptomyces]|uniref:hypothetical protein n=1 Tax=unclassified Streptomyces TaxID=2593676 RepID=UPI00363C66FB